MTTNLPPQSCPACGRTVDRHSCLDGEHRPTQGDISICIGCGDYAVYDESLVLQRPTPAQDIQIKRTTAWPIIMAARRKVLNKPKANNG